MRSNANNSIERRKKKFVSCTQTDFFLLSLEKLNDDKFFETKCQSTHTPVWMKRTLIWPKSINMRFFESFFWLEKQKKKEKIKMCSQIPNYFCRLLLCLDGIFNWTLSTSKIIYYHLKTACTPGDVRLPSCENDGHTLTGKCSIYSLKTLGKQQRNLIPLSIRICVKSSSSSKKNMV